MSIVPSAQIRRGAGVGVNKRKNRGTSRKQQVAAGATLHCPCQRTPHQTKLRLAPTEPNHAYRGAAEGDQQARPPPVREVLDGADDVEWVEVPQEQRLCQDPGEGC